MSRRRHLGVDTSTPPIGAQVSTRIVDASVKGGAEPSTLRLHLQGLKCRRQVSTPVVLYRAGEDPDHT